LKNWFNVKLFIFKIKYILSGLREMERKKNFMALSMAYLTFIPVHNRLSGEMSEIDFTGQDFELDL
jgi:hypothetical protein